MDVTDGQILKHKKMVKKQKQTKKTQRHVFIICTTDTVEVPTAKKLAQ